MSDYLKQIASSGEFGCRYGREFRKVRRWVGLFVMAWLAWVFVCLGFWGGVLYVVLHFIMKWW